MALRDTFLNMLGVETQEVQKTSNGAIRSARDFLRNGNRERLYPTWSDIKMSDSDMYRGYSYAVIQKRGNKVASLAKNNLKTWANQEVVDEFQKKNETVMHPYLKLIEDSTKFTEKQFWKNISIYLDLAGRYYLGVVRNTVKPFNPKLPVITTDPTEFVMLNPYEIRRVVDKNGLVAGYIERKKDGRYREWPVHQIIELRELNPFDPENSQWAMTDAAKNAVYTINQSGDYTRQSLNGNIDAPGIITTDVLLNDEDFANFKSRVTQHTKGEPLFGNGTGAIKWDSMQIDLDKAALLDINEINRTELFAVSGTSKTSLGIEQSGTTRETARVQSEQFISDTAQPRLEDIVDFLNLDYKKYYNREYKKTGYSIEVESAVGKDYDTEQKATALKQSQFQLAMQLIQAGYTTQSAYQFAEGEIDFADLELEKGIDKPKNPDQPEEPDESASNPQNIPPDSGSGGGNDKSIVSEEESGSNENLEDLNGLEPHNDLVENGGKGSGNFGHEGRPGLVGGSGDGGLTSFEEEISAIDNPDILYKKQESLVTTEVVSCLEKDSDSLTGEEKDVLKEFYDKTNLLRKKLFKLEWSDIEKADKKISEWISGALDWEFRDIDFDPVDIRLSKSTVQGMLDKESELIAYRIQATDRMEKSKGSSFSLSETFSESSPDSETPYVFAQKVTKENTILTPNIVQAGYGYELGPNWQHEIVLSNDKELMPINNSVEGEKCDPLTRNGGKGSGNFGHSGRPGEVGGSGNGSATDFQNELDNIESYHIPEATKAKLSDLQKINTYNKIEEYLASKGIEVDTDAESLKGERKDEVISSPADTFVRLAIGIEAYQDTFGSDALSSLKKVKFYDNDEDSQAAYYYSEIGEKEPKEGQISFRQWGNTGKTIFHELAHAFQDSHKKSGEDAVTYSDRMVKEAGLSEKSGSYMGASQSGNGKGLQAERFADAFAKGFASGNKEGLDFIERVAQIEKKKNHCTCEHDHKVETFINEVAQDDGKVVDKAYKEFLQEVRDIEKETIDASVRKVEVNAFEISDIIGPKKRKTLTEKLKNALHKYWWLIFPLFANNSMSKRNEEFGKDIGFVFSNELQAGVDDNALRVAEGHMETILNDILGASNRAYTNILEEAAAEIIINVYDDSPTKWEKYFEHKPTMAEALSSIRKTDILEENRKIYEKANKMAFEGYNRRDIIKAIREEYNYISETRATLIARNETSRAFTRSQFEADKQFLNSIGKLGQAYKVWYSRRPANEQDKICDFCNEMIRSSEENPVPFEEPFIKYGDSMEVVGNDGKLKIFTANYEDIEGGCLHPNCMCGYHLVFKNASGEFIKTLNGGSGSGNFGHSGRPGEVGGSGKGDITTGKDLFNAKMSDKLEAFRNLTPEEQAVFCEKAMEMDYSDMPQDLADTDFQRISYALGIKDKPKTVSDEEFKELVESGEMEYFRCVKDYYKLSSKEIAERLSTGEYTYQGNGDYCDGTYFTPDWGAMTAYSNSDSDSVIRSIVDIDANIYYTDAREPFDAKMLHTMRILEEKTGMKQNTSRAVALLGAGYDGWNFISGGVNKEYLCMLNRKYLTVNKDNYSLQKSDYERSDDVE